MAYLTYSRWQRSGRRRLSKKLKKTKRMKLSEGKRARFVALINANPPRLTSTPSFTNHKDMGKVKEDLKVKQAIKEAEQKKKGS